MSRGTLAVENLSKRYRGIPALCDVSFRLGAGEIFGYLGPNGSGKSATVKLVTAMLRPGAGRGLFQGSDRLGGLPAYGASLGSVPEEAQVYTHLSGLEYLQLIGRLRELPEKLIEHRANRMLELFGLQTWRWTPLSFYSKSMRQRVLIAAALERTNGAGHRIAPAVDMGPGAVAGPVSRAREVDDVAQPRRPRHKALRLFVRMRHTDVERTLEESAI